MKAKKLQQILSLLTCVLMMLAVAVNRDHKMLGHELTASKETKTDSVPASRKLADGTIVINTTTLGKNIKGYSGRVPLDIYVKDGKISKIEALPNNEAPDFFKRAAEQFKEWIGKTPKEATEMKVDAVTGATYSSQAIIDNVSVGMKYAVNTPTENIKETQLKAPSVQEFTVSIKFIAGLIVVLMASILPLFIKNKRYRLAQLALNVVVLGLWCGSFISYSLIVSYLSSGTNLLVSVVPLIMLITAFVYPLFGKKQYYCANVCPFGSLQVLANKCGARQITLSKRIVKGLDYFRQGLWAALMLCLWTGVLFELMDYEAFSAFIFTVASPAVIAIGAAFVILSLFIKRPYCRFVCPTGTLAKIAETSK